MIHYVHLSYKKQLIPCVLIDRSGFSVSSAAFNAPGHVGWESSYTIMFDLLDTDRISRSISHMHSIAMTIVSSSSFYQLRLSPTRHGTSPARSDFRPGHSSRHVNHTNCLPLTRPRFWCSDLFSGFTVMWSLLFPSSTSRISILGDPLIQILFESSSEYHQMQTRKRNEQSCADQYKRQACAAGFPT